MPIRVEWPERQRILFILPLVSGFARITALRPMASVDGMSSVY